MLLVDPNAKNKEDKKSTIKKNFPVLSSGLVEAYMNWTYDMWYIVKHKPCVSAASKFDIFKCLLAEKALDEWKTAEETVTQKL